VPHIVPICSFIALLGAAVAVQPLPQVPPVTAAKLCALAAARSRFGLEVGYSNARVATSPKPACWFADALSVLVPARQTMLLTTLSSVGSAASLRSTPCISLLAAAEGPSSSGAETREEVWAGTAGGLMMLLLV